MGPGCKVGEDIHTACTTKDACEKKHSATDCTEDATGGSAGTWESVEHTACYDESKADNGKADCEKKHKSNTDCTEDATNGTAGTWEKAEYLGGFDEKAILYVWLKKKSEEGCILRDECNLYKDKDCCKKGDCIWIKDQCKACSGDCYNRQSKSCCEKTAACHGRMVFVCHVEI